jgi:hypothetical protein
MAMNAQGTHLSVAASGVLPGGPQGGWKAIQATHPAVSRTEIPIASHKNGRPRRAVPDT